MKYLILLTLISCHQVNEYDCKVEETYMLDETVVLICHDY